MPELGAALLPSGGKAAAPEGAREAGGRGRQQRPAQEGPAQAASGSRRQRPAAKGQEGTEQQGSCAVEAVGVKSGKNGVGKPRSATRVEDDPGRRMVVVNGSGFYPDNGE